MLLPLFSSCKNLKAGKISQKAKASHAGCLLEGRGVASRGREGELEAEMAAVRAAVVAAAEANIAGCSPEVLKLLFPDRYLSAFLNAGIRADGRPTGRTRDVR